MKNFSFSIVKASDIESTVWSNFNQVFDVVKTTYLAYEQNMAVNPPSTFLKFQDMPNARIIALPAAINNDSSKLAGIKWIASNPDNIKLGFPRASAVIILNDYETGYPYACLEGSVISAVRTACSAVLAASYLRKDKKINKLGVIGNGLIAQHILECFFRTEFDIFEIVLFDLDFKRSESFIHTLSESYQGKVTIAKTKEELISASDVIVFTTTAQSPYVSDPSLFSHNPIVLNISLRDLSHDILIGSNNVVDDIEHVLSANTSPHLTFKEYGHKDFINGTLVGLMNNTLLIDPSKPTIFSPMGMGILDIALAGIVHELSMNTKKELVIDDFFNCCES